MDKRMTNSLYNHYLSDSVPKGVFIISHGMAEHLGRYNWLISKLNSDGYHVISRDHRGHGRNIKNRKDQGYFSDNDGWLKVRNDLVETIDYVNSQYPNIDCFLLGHSMGSWVALSTLNTKQPISGLILTGSSKLPKISIILNLIIVKLNIFFKGRFNESEFIHNITIGRFNSQYKPNRTNNDWISSDHKSVDNYTNDKQCGFIVKSGLWLDLCHGLLSIFKRKYYSDTNSKIPILIMSGEYDAASGNAKLAKVLANFLKTKFVNITFKVINNSRHEVFTEVNKISSYNYLLNYIKQL